MKEEKFTANISGGTISSNSKVAYTLCNENFFGEKKGEKIVYSAFEAMFLFKNKGMKIFQNNKKISSSNVSQKLTRINKNFELKYRVYEELRKKGLILKSAIKYGADFSVYEKGKKPGIAHSTWLLSVVPHSKKTSWEEFILKNRVANSTKKKVILAIQDTEGNIIYYEVNWKKF